MKKFLTQTCGVLFLLALTTGLAACTNEQNNTNQSGQSGGAIDIAVPNQPGQPGDAGQPGAPDIEPPPAAGESRTLAELGATIVAVGEFWNRWYASHPSFDWAHIDNSRSNWQPFDEAILPGHHPLSRGFAVVLPSSGFTRLDDVGEYLLQFYTSAWVDSGVFAEPPVAMQIHEGYDVTIFGLRGFEEYDGELFVFVQPEMSARPDWATATHRIIEQNGGRAVVETVVTTAISVFVGDDMPTITYRFTFENGKISDAHGRWNEAAESQSPASPRDDIDIPGGGFDTTAIRPRTYAPVGEHTLLHIYRPEDSVPGYFDAMLYMPHPTRPGDNVVGDMIIAASRQISDVSLILLEHGWNASANADTFTVTESFLIAQTLPPGEAIQIQNISVGGSPRSGISLTDGLGERHYFAIHYDTSGWGAGLMLLVITEQMG
ncbi:MAG: hypothetical protein FWC70_10605 [Defluviitaleaceae bacterium]|nr:hypothetical protein [Defluviitaleaceae bacterium]